MREKRRYLKKSLRALYYQKSILREEISALIEAADDAHCRDDSCSKTEEETKKKRKKGDKKNNKTGKQ
jgi:hypothetical protein